MSVCFSRYTNHPIIATSHSSYIFIVIITANKRLSTRYTFLYTFVVCVLVLHPVTHEENDNDYASYIPLGFVTTNSNLHQIHFM